MADATCYGSLLRYPTNEKLLWESIEWTYGRIVDLSRKLKLRRPRSKYNEIRKRYMNFSRNRKKTQKKKGGESLHSLTSCTLKTGIIYTFTLQ
jgi:hypothetical protein